MKNINLLVLSGVMLVAKFGSAQSLVVTQSGDSTYTITSDAKPSKLLWSAHPDSWADAKNLPAATPETVTIASAHPIVKMEATKKKAAYAAPREIRLKGATNFRDMGGYRTKDGKEVRYGKVFRSADISKLTDADVVTLASLNLKMVCDLRSEKENETSPDRLPAGTEHLLLSAGSEQVGNNSFMKSLKSEKSADSMMMSFYSRTDHLAKKYKPMFDQLLALPKDQALLFHCTAGKDRTGVGAALLLYALGADENVIYDDYEATNIYRQATNEQAVQAVIKQGLPEAAARKMMAASRVYLQATFTAIGQTYGSIDTFLEKEIGLTPAKMKQLKQMYLYE